MASVSPDPDTFDLADMRDAFEALAQELIHKAVACRRTREVTESVYQREKLRGKEAAYTESARIARMVVPGDQA
jgi:uncharacterized protein (DUF2384 family)